MGCAMDIADEIITLSSNKGNAVSNLKLQKMMYFLNALSLVKDGVLLIDDGQKFEKWDYGPVIHSVYTEYSSNGRNEITEPKVHCYFNFGEDGVLEPVEYEFKEEDMNCRDRDFISQNIELFLCYTASQLVGFSHYEPQWQNKIPYVYDEQETKEFYSQARNRFWEKSSK